MSWKEEEYLMLSGLQHFAFCRRQWALIHIEQQWAENLLTIEGSQLHERAHTSGLKEVRGDVITIRGMRVSSSSLGVSGQCDVLEYHLAELGICLEGQKGLWQPYPIEYKRGKPKAHDADRLQLCCQAMCLEDMLCCDIPEGALFYGETRRREVVSFSDSLRKKVEVCLKEMHELFHKGYTPRVRMEKKCQVCSLKEICLP